ncbi:MAG: hypothetical protein ABI647_13340 [Gemmatimonadota bacterium]
MTASAATEPLPAATNTTETRFDLALVIAAGLVLYALNVDFSLFGDAPVYADLVIQGRFDELTLHIGYYAVLFALDRTVGAVFGLPIQETAVWLNVVAGALTLGVVYLLARIFLGTRRDALLTVAVFAVSGRVLDNATTVEIYMLQTLLVLSSFYLFARERVVASGVVAALAMLVSPLSIFAYLFYPVLDYQRAGRVRWKVLITLTVAALLVYLPYFAVLGRELLWGTRGLLVINKALRLDPVAMALNFPLFQFKAYTVMLLLLIPALFAVRKERRFLAVTLAVAIPHLYVILKLTSEDNVFILNTDFFFACWVVIGWRTLAQSKVGRRLAPVPWLGHLTLLLLSGSIFCFQPRRGYAAEMKSIGQTYVQGHDAVVITDWDMGVSLTYYARPAVTTTLEHEPFYQQIVDLDNLPKNPPPITAAEIYLLDSWKPGTLNRLLRSKASIAAQTRQHAVVARAERRLHIQCTPLLQGTHRLYRCTRPNGAAAEPALTPPPSRGPA